MHALNFISLTKRTDTFGIFLGHLALHCIEHGLVITGICEMINVGSSVVPDTAVLQPANLSINSGLYTLFSPAAARTRALQNFVIKETVQGSRKKTVLLVARQLRGGTLSSKGGGGG